MSSTYERGQMSVSLKETLESYSMEEEVQGHDLQHLE